MAVNIVINRIDTTDKGVIVEGQLVLSGNYTTGGDTVDFTGVASTITYTPEGHQHLQQIPSNLPPLGLFEVAEQPASGAAPQGYELFYITGSTMANGLLWVATALGQPPTQLNAGAYPAGALAQTNQFRAYFNFGV